MTNVWKQEHRTKQTPTAETGFTQRGVTDAVIQLAVSSNFSEEQGHCGNTDPGQRGHRIFDFSPYLILPCTRHQTHRLNNAVEISLTDWLGTPEK